MCAYFAAEGYEVHGLDNNQRAVFFGPAGDTRWNQARLERDVPGFVHHELDIRDRAGVLALVEALRPAAIVHAAAQPSHDRPLAMPFEDFDTNAVGTLNLLEAARRSCPESPLVHLSTNKVYGDRPNAIRRKELETRWDYDDAAFARGIPEDVPIDHCTHSLLGASKLAADVEVQEYGRYFGMPTCCLRAGCLTGPNHAGVELHGFLSHLVRCNLERREYRVYGYKGKQVRDNLHSRDVARFAHEFVERPRSGEVYNLGGGKANSCSLLEAFALAEEQTGQRQVWSYVEENRIADHVVYYSDLRKAREHYPGWDVSVSLRDIFAEIAGAWRGRLKL
jgi:CDP-paratose 2-epimerase